MDERLYGDSGHGALRASEHANDGAKRADRYVLYSNVVAWEP